MCGAGDAIDPHFNDGRSDERSDHDHGRWRRAPCSICVCFCSHCHYFFSYKIERAASLPSQDLLPPLPLRSEVDASDNEADDDAAGDHDGVKEDEEDIGRTTMHKWATSAQICRGEPRAKKRRGTRRRQDTGEDDFRRQRTMPEYNTPRRTTAPRRNDAQR